MRRSSRRAKLAVVAIVATASALAGIALAGDERPRRPKVSTVDFVMPSGRPGTLTVTRADRSSGWCARVTIGGRRARPAEREACGEDAEPGFHGSWLADCASREAVVFGLVDRHLSTSATVRRGVPRRARYAPLPSGVDVGSSRFYVVGVDLRAPRPAVVAVDADGRTVAEELLGEGLRQCRDGGFGGVMGGF